MILLGFAYYHLSVLKGLKTVKAIKAVGVLLCTKMIKAINRRSRAVQTATTMRYKSK